MSELDLRKVRETRALHPQLIAEAAGARERRLLLSPDGRLMIVAADHPARGALGVGPDPLAMADRDDLLSRLVTALRRPGVDGVLAAPDVLEDLLLLGALEGKVVLASMNRGGLRGSTFELDDRFTASDPDSVVAMGYDGGKMLCRIDLEDAATVATLEACGRAVTALAKQHRVAMIEPFMSHRENGRVRNVLTAEAVVHSVAVASALGATSAYTWLKLPVVEDMAQVMAATTLPTVLLGGDPGIEPAETYASWSSALSLPGVRGLVVGRALLYPRDGDVEGAVDVAVRLVRGATRPPVVVDGKAVLPEVVG